MFLISNFISTFITNINIVTLISSKDDSIIAKHRINAVRPFQCFLHKNLKYSTIVMHGTFGTFSMFLLKFKYMPMNFLCAVFCVNRNLKTTGYTKSFCSGIN